MCGGTLVCTVSDVPVPKGKVSRMGGGACTCVRACEHHKLVSANPPPHQAGDGALCHPQWPPPTGVLRALDEQSVCGEICVLFSLSAEHPSPRLAPGERKLLPEDYKLRAKVTPNPSTALV